MSLFEEKLHKKLESVISGVTPGIQVQVHCRGQKQVDVAVGETFPYYDLASVTKIIFTTIAMMRTFEKGKWSLESKVKDILPWFPNPNVRVIQCLNHSAGLTWWKPYFEEMNETMTTSQKWEVIRADIESSTIEIPAASHYSDLSFFVLGFLLQKMEGKGLLQIWAELKEDLLTQTTLNFHNNNEPIYPVKQYAPTEEGGWREKRLQGEVNDDNTWMLGGVAPHAGLFGSIDDLGWYALFIRSLVHGAARTQIRSKTVQLFVHRSLPLGHGDWGLGFMMPSKDSTLVGPLFSPQSIGHWGFTGCSMWYDPKADLSVSICANRTWYGRENKKFNELRPQLHTWIMESMRK